MKSFFVATAFSLFTTSFAAPAILAGAGGAVVAAVKPVLKAAGVADAGAIVTRDGLGHPAAVVANVVTDISGNNVLNGNDVDIVRRAVAVVNAVTDIVNNNVLNDNDVDVVSPRALAIVDAITNIADNNVGNDNDIDIVHRGLPTVALVDAVTNIADNNVGNDNDIDIVRRDVNVKAILAIVAKAELELKPILAKLRVKGVVIADVKLLVPRLLAILADLKIQIGHIKAHPESAADCHDIAIHISGLIGEILVVLKHLVVDLHLDIKVLAPLIVKVGVAINGVLDVAVHVVAGLNVVILAPLRAYVAILARLGITLVVAGVRV